MSKLRVAVALSGGVDSSVAALILLEQGYEVHAVFMKNWEDSYEPGYCTAGEDLSDAQEVCETLGIPLHLANFAAQYRQQVFQHFLEEYRRGRTPNPDILCNKEIKFKAFSNYAWRLGADRIATGHYARLLKQADAWHLLKGADPEKDQSYFLYTLDQTQLARVMFPVGELHKRQVRELAASANLITHDKKDSTGICFIGERRFRDFLSHYLSARSGEIRTCEGERVGQHIGLMFYTLGQRQGLGIGGRTGNPSGEPWYVIGKDLSRNILLVAQGRNHPLLFHSRLQASQLHWIAGKPPELPFPCQAKIRYRQPDQACTLEAVDQDSCQVLFQEPQRAIAPGQSVVFYRGNECLGGGIIDTVSD